jgi:hypothetical protein
MQIQPFQLCFVDQALHLTVNEVSLLSKQTD